MLRIGWIVPSGGALQAGIYFPAGKQKGHADRVPHALYYLFRQP